MNNLSEKAKAVVALVLGFAVYVVGRVGTDAAVIPSLSPFDWKAWILLVVSMVGGYSGVYATPNYTSDPVKANNQSMAMKPPVRPRALRRRAGS